MGFISAVNVFLSIVAFLLMLIQAYKRPRLRLVFGLIAVFCFYCGCVYSYILIFSPAISEITAGLGRTGITLSLASLIMLAIIIDR
jgi:hypothetical protein